MSAPSSTPAIVVVSSATATSTPMPVASACIHGADSPTCRRRRRRRQPGRRLPPRSYQRRALPASPYAALARIATPVSTASSTASPQATPSYSATVVSTATISSTPSPSPSSTSTSTSTATFTATPTRPRPTATATVPTATPPVPTPGPRPAAVPQPGPSPATEPLPPPLPPLPGWVTLPIAFSTASADYMLDNQLAANGYGHFTQQQLIDEGAMVNVNGYLPPITGPITTPFGGSTPFQSFHTGVDIAGPNGTPVHAGAGGIVIHAGLAVPGQPTQSYGNCVVIMHNPNTVTIYGHMQIGVHDLQVRVGEVVSQGQVLGYEGQTGWATGPHVHFEMRINNVAFDPLLLVNESLITGS